MYKPTQQMYYIANKDNTYTFYLVNHIEERYCVIPNKYNGLAKQLYGVRLDCIDTIINDIAKDYELVPLEKVNG